MRQATPQTDRLVDLVDPFFGTASTDFAPKEGLAASWFFPKAQAGNTHPGACLPFGMVSACAYSGAYVTGYGKNDVNTNGRPPHLFDKMTATGFTHLHQSGTGAINSYYNYFKVSPLPRPGTPNEVRYHLAEETASPGYYGALLDECGIKAELTVSPCGAIHWYHFPVGSMPCLAIDFVHGGLLASNHGAIVPSAARAYLTEDGFEGAVVMEGIPIYVCGRLRQKAAAAHLYVGSRTIGEQSVSFADGDEIPATLGVCLEADTSNGMECELLLAFSLKDAAQARKNLASFADQSFDDVRQAATVLWEERLGRIQVDGNDAARRLFYSAFYHLLHDMAARIALHGGDTAFVRDLERFFGYGAPAAQQQVDPSDHECMARGFSLNRFEGFNNEPDMETPYAFIYAGHHARTCEIVRAGMRHQFRLGRGGLPGNNDSGGLTSAYVWNAIGLFPVAGQSYMLIGSPVFEHVTIRLPQGEMRIAAEGTSSEACYVGSATLNGKALDRAYLTMKEFLEGGELRLRMCSNPSDWAKANRPPSYQRVEQLSRGDI